MATEQPLHVMSARSALDVLGVLREFGVDFCLGGGWAVDALLSRQTREHSDLDLWVPSGQAHELFRGLASSGIDRIYPWLGDRPWNFVLHDGASLRVDLHFYEPLGNGTWHYGSAVDGEDIPDEALTATGTIGGVRLRTEAAAWSVRWHCGYPLRDIDRHDVPLLCERFGIAVPAQYAEGPC